MDIIPNGTEVLIFEYIREWGPRQDDENYISKGIIKSSKQSEDLSYHGSPWYEQIYEVLGEDGKEYTGTYGIGSVFNGNMFFRTKEHQIYVLNLKISDNEEKILKLKEKNNEYLKKIAILENELKQQSPNEPVKTKKLTLSKNENNK